MPIKKSDLYSSLWSSCDELRGGMDASQYKDYVLVLLFIKYISAELHGDHGLLDQVAGLGTDDVDATFSGGMAGAGDTGKLGQWRRREIADLQHAAWSIRRITGGGRGLPGPNGEGRPPRARGAMVKNGGKPGNIAGRKPKNYSILPHLGDAISGRFVR